MTKAYLHSLPPHAKPSPSTKSNYTTQLQPKSPLNTMSMTANYHWQVVLSSTVIQSHNLQQLEALHHHSSTLDHQDTFLIHHHNFLSSNWNLHYIDIHHQCIHMEAGIHRYCVDTGIGMCFSSWVNTRKKEIDNDNDNVWGWILMTTDNIRICWNTFYMYKVDLLLWLG